MKVKSLVHRQSAIGDAGLKPGEVYDLADEDARSLIAAGNAVAVDAVEDSTDAGGQTPKPSDDRGTDVKPE